MPQVQPGSIDRGRRRVLGAAAVALAAAELGVAERARADAAPDVYFRLLKQVDAGVLNTGYVDAGVATGPVVILLHGWPYDIHSFVEVVPLLVAAGYRVIVPSLRGYGTTRFLSKETVRNGQQSVLANDIVVLMDALGIRTAVLAGFDWGARTANVVAALWPERCRGHRQLVCRLACEMELSRVGGRDDDTCLPELRRLPLPG